jgi:hypothetical protein
VKRLLAGAALLAMAGCAHAVPVAPVVPMHTTAVCVDLNNVRVPDDYCPIGDGLGLNDGYGWDYYPPYSDGLSDVIVPYVGYPVAPGWSRTRPVNVTTINIQRGNTQSPPAGVTATVGKVAASPKASSSVTDVGTAGSSGTRSSTITRGGLGVKPVPVAKAPAPAPKPPAPPTRKMGK